MALKSTLNLESNNVYVTKMNKLIGETFDLHAGRALASLIKSLSDFDLAEDVLQEAMLVAIERWPRTLLPG